MLDAVLGDEVLTPECPKVESAAYQPLLGTRYVGRASGFVIGFADVAGELGLSLLNLPAMPMRGMAGELRLPFEDIAAGPFVLDCQALVAGEAPPQTILFGESGVPEAFDLLVAPPEGLARLGGELVGDYHVPDLDATASISRDGDALSMCVKGHLGRTHMVFESIGPDVLAWQMGATDIPLRGIAHLHRSDGQVESISIDTTRTRGMRFVRRRV
jgi:hypothetical protein